jgi:hypothetical protein
LTGFCYGKHIIAVITVITVITVILVASLTGRDMLAKEFLNI